LIELSSSPWVKPEDFDWEGLRATGDTLEECKNNLEKVIQRWLVVKLKRGHPIPPWENKITANNHQLSVPS
jgi:predicted RNase H-like HicB family nuclease